MKEIDGKLFLSKSDLTLFLDDPKTFKEVMVEGEEMEQTFWMWVGSSIHEFNEYFFSAVRVDNNNLQLPEIPDRFTKNSTLKNLIMNFMGLEIDRFESMPNKNYFYPKIIEEKLYNNKLGIYGVIDRVDEVDDGLQIVEIKTSKGPLTSFELVFYYLILEDIYPNLSRTVKIMDIRNTKTYIYNITDECKKTVIEIINYVRTRIENEDFG